LELGGAAEAEYFPRMIGLTLAEGKLGLADRLAQDETGAHHIVGARRAMIAAISLVRRLDGVDATTFRRHWLEVHGPLVCKFAGLRHYTQCHIVERAVTTESARMLRIDGFPLLFFDTDADRRLAHGSPEMAACDIDSRQFIGAVSRVITEVVEIVPRTTPANPICLIVLYPQQTDKAAAEAHLADLGSQPTLQGLVRYRVLEQGPAPNSRVPHLAVAVGSMAQAWFSSEADLQSALAGRNHAGVALFAVEEHRLM
jgi:uncharacterized protein (TIGR02118 family)